MDSGSVLKRYCTGDVSEEVKCLRTGIGGVGEGTVRYGTVAWSVESG